MRYYKGDIVEIINKPDDEYHITVGYRYRVGKCSFLENNNIECIWLLNGKRDDDYNLCDPFSVFLYHRPLKNWVKYILRFKQ